MRRGTGQRHGAPLFILLLTFLLAVPAGGRAAASPALVAGSTAPSATAAPIATAVTAAMTRSPPFVLPLPGAAVLTPFRAPAHPYGPGHRGVDLGAAAGTPVRSAGAGVVTHAGPVAGRGTVTVEHFDGLRTTYEPVTATVRAGKQVGIGEPIGLLQAGHLACAPASCLHWGARLSDGTYLDPMGLINGLAVRLLPWDQARG